MGRTSRHRYQIRHASPEDYPGVTAVFAGPRAVWGTLQLPFPSPEVWRKRLSEPEPGMVCLVACAGSAKAGELVGLLGVHTHPNLPRRKHAGELGMAVRDDWQGRGVGTALLQAALDLADGWLNLSRLELVVWNDNEPALRLYRRHGFEVEGTLRRYGWRDGREVDAFILGRLRPETKGSVA